MVRMSAYLSKPGKHLAVVDFQQNPHIELFEHLVHYLHQFQFTQLATAAYGIHIALVELAITPFLRTVRTPHRLNLETLERERKLILMLNHISCKRDGKVIPQPLFAHLRRKGLLHIYGSECISGIKNPEEKFIPLVAIFTHKGGKILHSRSIYLRISVCAEYGTDRIEYIIPFGHLLRTEISCPFGN